MPRYLFTILALVVFLFAYILVEYQVFTQNVSPETALAEYRELRTIREGVTLDGNMRISEVIDPPHVSQYTKIANHGRDLRAFLAPNKGGVGLVYIEQARPHKFFALVGAFAVLPETVAFMWTAPTTLIFYGTAPDGTFMRYTINLHTLAMTSMPIAASPQTAIGSTDVLTGE
jgi:hypothetical protein